MYCTEGAHLRTLDEKYEQTVRNFKSEYQRVVYYVIHNYSCIGELLTFLYVSKHEEEWELERRDLENGTPIAFVVNVDNNLFSEFGSVGIESVSGRVIRTF